MVLMPAAVRRAGPRPFVELDIALNLNLLGALLSNAGWLLITPELFSVYHL